MSRVIRGGGKVVAAEVIDAREEAQRLIEEAKAEADALLAEARGDGERLREEARRAGAEAGRAEAAALLVEAQARREAVLDEAEGALARLATEAARRIVREELALAPERVAAIAADLLARVRRARQVTVRVAAGDAEHLRASLPAGATLEVSAELAAGDVVVVTEVGELDGRIEVQLDALRHALEGT